jgi:hypothetical protein
VDGVSIVELSSWKMFHSFIEKSLLDSKSCIFRGQRDTSWKLEPSFDRLVHNCGKEPTEEILREHLKKFQYSKRGRHQHSNSNEFGDDDWWALGQHYGLATPLLDWTESPFIASYFAFLEKNNGSNNKRVIYVLDKNPICDTKNFKEIFDRPIHYLDDQLNDYQYINRSPAIRIFYPQIDDNPRMIAQKGVFVRGPIGIDIETYVKTRFKGLNTETILMKVLIHDNENDREQFLKSLNRMNINHLTLFPDLQGASVYSNMSIEIDNY